MELQCHVEGYGTKAAPQATCKLQQYRQTTIKILP